MNSAAINEQVNRILRSRAFATKAQLRKLLEVLSQNLESQSALTPDLVIRELWPDEVRTKRSADVATEMNRLRHALESYYSGEGQSDAIAIVLPNRGAGSNGTHEKRWIVAKPRDEKSAENGSTIERPQPAARTSWRRILVSAAAVFAVSIAVYIAWRVLALPDQPRAGRLDGSTLAILNADGKELWKKNFPEAFHNSYYQGGGLASRLWFADLDGDGHTSVLFSYLPAVDPLSHACTLICYSDRGEEKWRWTPGRDLPELSGSPATYWIQTLAVMKATPAKPLRIAVSSFHDYWYPNQIALLDSRGKLQAEYWHTGHLDFMKLADLDGDGKQEIVAGGISNGFRQATLIVLDPDHVSGASAEPNRPEVQIRGMGEAHERLRLLFPRSDVNRDSETYNSVYDMAVEHGTIRVAVRECEEPGCVVMYEFDKNFRLRTAYAADAFQKIHTDFYLKTKHPHPFSPAEQTEFTKVRCLVGCKTEVVAFGDPPNH